MRVCVQATIKRAVCTRIEIRSRRFEHFIRSSVTGKFKYLACTFTRCFFIYLFIYFNAANFHPHLKHGRVFTNHPVYISCERRGAERTSEERNRSGERTSIYSKRYLATTTRAICISPCIFSILRENEPY